MINVIKARSAEIMVTSNVPHTSKARSADSSPYICDHGVHDKKVPALRELIHFLACALPSFQRCAPTIKNEIV
jgi:hypothetical protein